MNFKFNRQLSNREFFLVWLLMFVIFTAVLINYLFLPSFDAYKIKKDNINYLKLNSDIKEKEYEKMPVYKKTINQSLASIELSLREIPANLYDDETMVLINKFAKNSQVDISTYIFMPAEITPFDQWIQKNESLDYQIEHSFVVTQKTELNIHSNYNQMIHFIQLIENFDQKMYIENLSIVSDEENQIYAKINVVRVGYFDKDIHKNSVKYNALRAQGYGHHMFLNKTSPVVEEEIKQSYQVSNHLFSLIINDSKSVAPKFIMRSTVNESSQIFLNTDKSVEGNLKIFEKDEKIMYEYAIDNQNFSGDLTINNLERMDFNIYSCQRQENDHIALLLSVENTTQWPLVIHTFNDDAKMPRLTLKSVKGNVRLEKEDE